MKAAVKADPNKPGRFELTFTGNDFIAVTIDGKNLQPADGQLIAAISLSHVKHML
ncbi:MAG: hypothetical protein KKD74_05850 [Bacteroidetes bacterium]|nr:hypothetical protein [Bacteroidota bacterium]